MKRLIVPGLLLFCLNVNGQKTIDVTSGDVNAGNLLNSIGGEPVLMAKFTALVEGTNFFSNDWLNGTIVLPGGKEYKGLSIKLDLFHNEVHYKDKDGKEFIATVPIKEVILTENHVNHRFIHSSAIKSATDIKEGYYLWLHTGPTSLYKYYSKQLSEYKPYGSATTEQKIKTTDNYLVLHNGVLIQIKKLKDAPTVLANKKKELEEYLKSNENKTRNLDDRFTDLVTYYNQLTQEKK